MHFLPTVKIYRAISMDQHRRNETKTDRENPNACSVGTYFDERQVKRQSKGEREVTENTTGL